MKDISKYSAERDELKIKLLEILEITRDNNKLSLKDLDKNITKQELIISLEPYIKKYFLYSRWSYFTHKTNTIKRRYLSLLKTLIKKLDIKMTVSTLVNHISENKTECETYYIFYI